MRVFCLNPSYGDDFCRSARWAAKSRGRVQRHPDWYLIAVAVLERAGHEVKFLDAAALNVGRAETLRVVREFRPDLFIFHTTTPSINSDLSYARAVKDELDIPTVAFGPHVTAEPDDTFKLAGGGLDVVVRGEYDYTFLDLADGKPLGEVPGVSYLDHGKVVHNEERPPCDIDDLPFPAWHHVKPEWYRDAGKLYPFLTLISGRGCFGRCTFCRDVQVMYGRRLRMRKPALIVDEIEDDFRRFPQIREVMFETDTFTAVPKHVEAVCREILDRGLDVTWSCNTRVDTRLDLLPLMKKAGCRMLMVGFEFGSQAALDAVKKGVTLNQSVRFAREASRLGFTIHGCFMVGAPGETPDMARETFRLARSLPLDTIQVSGICTYPGTELYRWAREGGYIVPQRWEDWVDENREQVTLLSYPQLSKEQIDALIDEGLRSFYLRPRQLLKMVGNIRTWGDIRRKLYGLRSFLDYFFLSRFRRRKI
ncbi:MAG: B12-binding domain-containing radical SAM protein [Promethearchaeota archaeon]